MLVGGRPAESLAMNHDITIRGDRQKHQKGLADDMVLWYGEGEHTPISANSLTDSKIVT